MFGKKPRETDPRPDAPESANLPDDGLAEESPALAGERDEAAEAAAAAAQAAAAALASGPRRSDRHRRSEKPRREEPSGGEPVGDDNEPSGILDVIKRTFSDRSRRMRVLIWTVTSAFLVLALTIVALGATSTYWFCANGCHKVQDDTIVAYQRSAHNRIHCMACHMPVGAPPTTFMLHKVEALGELYMTVTSNYSLPLNPENEVSLEMSSEQCTQCHTLNRLITPSPGIVINHEAHAKEGVNCTVCHNRVAHVEDFKLANLDPKTGKPNQKHEDFMNMSACFRCHTQETGAKRASESEGGLTAPGKCEVCHPKGFQLKPQSHLAQGFFPGMHGDLAKEQSEKVERAEAAEKLKKAQELSAANEDSKKGGVEIAAASEGGGEEHLELRSTKTVHECYTCHKESFCTDCHGAPMPHPDAFKKNHREYVKKDLTSCGQCHEGSGTNTCDSCHHGPATGWKYDQKLVWRTQQHPKAATQLGVSPCFKCHKPTYCAKCHVNGRVTP
ncbi:MAG: NapC/NirT family cytochrome c [Coriobacteriales bacterium]|nr:NapC/NirT family cytochrome c [Coriobacteriales bacterium]